MAIIHAERECFEKLLPADTSLEWKYHYLHACKGLINVFRLLVEDCV